VPRGLSITVDLDDPEPIVVDHAGQRLKVFVKHKPRRHGEARVIFDGPRSFVVRRLAVAERQGDGLDPEGREP
jgi:hypothetical protein